MKSFKKWNSTLAFSALKFVQLLLNVSHAIYLFVHLL